VFKHERLIRCQERKAVLLQRSTAHRLSLAAEAQSLRTAAGWVDNGMAFARKARANWLLLAPLLVLRKKQKRESTGFVHRVVQGISFGRAILSMWRNWR